jgi:hypothetical protein
MPGKEETIKQVHHALEYETRVNLHRYPLRIGYTDGAVVLEGEVGDVATKKLALELAAAVEGVRGVVDRLHVALAERKGDGAIRDALGAFCCASRIGTLIRVRAKGRVETVRDAGAEGAAKSRSRSRTAHHAEAR